MVDVGDSLAQYTVQSVLGRGGMGSVFRAHDARLQRDVALKVLSGPVDGNARLLREARAAAALDHPNAVTIFEVGEHEGALYIVMELVSGLTLREHLERGEAPASRRLAWLTEIARTLAAAHRRGLVHRDIKPENVMVRDDGVVKVLDFGIARRKTLADPVGATQPAAMATVTQQGLLIGTPLYMAPEQIRGGAVDGRCDQFSWGVLAYELLTGRPPWRSTDDAIAVIASVLTDTPEPSALERAGVAPAVREVVLRALHKSPEERFASMDDLLAALAAPTDVAPGEPPSDERRASLPTPTIPLPPSSPDAVAPTLAGRYSTGEVRAILERALERQAQAGETRGFSFDELVVAAREAGIEDATLEQVSRELRAATTPASAPAGSAIVSRADTPSFEAWMRRRRRGFRRHLGVYLIVNAALVLMGLLVGTLIPMLMPALFWGIGVGIHAMTVYTADEEEWREQQAHRAHHLARRARVGRVIDEAATELLRAGEAHRVRVAELHRVRVEAAQSEQDVSEAIEEEVHAAALEAAVSSRRGRRRPR